MDHSPHALEGAEEKKAPPYDPAKFYTPGDVYERHGIVHTVQSTTPEGDPLSVEYSTEQKRCAGPNCIATQKNGFTHSNECVAEYEKAVGYRVTIPEGGFRNGDTYMHACRTHTVLATADGVPVLTRSMWGHAGILTAGTPQIHQHDLHGSIISTRDDTPSGEPVHLGGCDLNYGTSDGKGGLVPPPIEGRRKLSPYELALIEKVKELGKMAELLDVEIGHYLVTQRDEANARANDPEATSEQRAKALNELVRMDKSGAHRHLFEARSAFEHFSMRLSRAIAQPSTYA